jgi:putative DNA primase/helicase
MAAETLAVATFQNKTDNQPRQLHVSWEKLVHVLTNHHEREEKDGLLWSPTLYTPGMPRGKANVVSVSALVLDFDHEADPVTFTANWSSWEYVMHTTFTHTDAEPRWRAVFPFTDPVAAEQWPHAWAQLIRLFSGASADKSCKDASRIYYLPACRPGAPHGAHVNPGRRLDPTEFLRPTVTLLVSRAHEHLGEGRNNAGMWLACQLRDNNYTQREAEDARWHTEVPTEQVKGDGHVDAYTEQEWLDTVRKVFSTSARKPWTSVPHSAVQRSAIEIEEPPGDRAVFRLTDEGNAERLVYHYGSAMRYCFETGQWLLWCETHWRPDTTNQVERLVVNVARHILRQAADVEDKVLHDLLKKQSKEMESRRGINAALELARKHVAISPDELDADPLLINTMNGTFDVRTGTLRDHSKSDLISCLCPAEYQPDARDAKLDAFLSDVASHDDELLAFLQRSAGYSLTGETGAKALFMVIGPPDTGKTTFFEALAGAAGNYARNSDFETFIQRSQVGSPRPDIARLAGARFVYAVETDAGSSLASGKVKLLTGGDKVTARFLHAREFEFAARFKLWLAANDAPRLSHSDDALWNRVQRVPFLHKPDKKDTTLLAHFRNGAASALLTWLLTGAHAWYRQGLGSAAMVEQARTTYREEMNPFSAFFEDHCQFSGEHQVLSGGLWEEYCRVVPLLHRGSRVDMAKELKTLGCTETRLHGGTRAWRGIGLIASKGGDPRLFD